MTHNKTNNIINFNIFQKVVCEIVYDIENFKNLLSVPFSIDRV